MGVIAIITPDDVLDDDQIAPTRRGTPGEGGGVVPTGLAGYTYDGAAYCPECARDVEVTSGGDGETYNVATFPADHHDKRGFGVGIVSCTDEWDHPGAACDVCHKTLRTNILVYDEGGAYPTPVVEVRDPDGQGRTAEAFVLERDAGEARVMLAEDFTPYAEAGGISWIPASDIIT